MKLALDYDGTYTRDPRMWRDIVRIMQSHGHDVACVTMRSPRNPVCAELARLVSAVHYTSLRAKMPWCQRHGVQIDVWIDDCPAFCVTDAQGAQTIPPRDD